MIVAGAEVAIGAQFVVLATGNKTDLGVGFQVKEAIDHLYACSFQIPRPTDVCFFVKSRFQFHQCGNRLSRLGGAFQRGNDWAVVRGSVQGLLDGNDVRILRRLIQKPHHHVETLKRMVDDEILGSDSGETVAVKVTDTLGKAGVEGLKLQIRTFDV